MQTSYLEIKKYWNDNPCSGGNKWFPFSATHGLKVLEVGCGAGIDALRFVKADAYYTGIDLTDKAIELTKSKIGDFGTAYKMNAEELDFPDNYFDIVYSFGVIHHAVNPVQVVREIHRVLKPNGFFYFMLYHKNSFRYWIDIMFFRSILWYLRFPKYNSLRKLEPNPTREQWISWNTDNLGCPLSRVFTTSTATELVKGFKKTTLQTPYFSWFLRGYCRK